MAKNLSWLSHLINLGGALTGIILTAVGGVMVLNAALKLYVFQFQGEAYQIVTTQECQYDRNLGTEEPRERTPEEIEQCKAERREEQKMRFRRQKEENMVDGLAMLLVGIPFWIIFDRRRKARK
ncbi:MAG: hypothetical protein K9M51_02935 [Candidatus Gracilibacteria bacterium]|nr:hypothetical protein [Candidatus Gracilibacteria bacterium]